MALTLAIRRGSWDQEPWRGRCGFCLTLIQINSCGPYMLTQESNTGREGTGLRAVQPEPPKLGGQEKDVLPLPSFCHPEQGLP